MMSLRLPEKTEKRLSQLAKETHRTKSYYVKLAVEEFLEDQEDLLIALSRMERINKGIDHTIPFEEIVKEHVKKYGKEGLEY